MEIPTDVRSFPTAKLRAPFETGSGMMRIKVEINTYETSPKPSSSPFCFSMHTRAATRLGTLHENAL